MIEFRDANDLSRVLATYSVAPQRPSKLCAANMSTLLFVTGSQYKEPYQVHWLDLTATQLKPAAGKRVIHPQVKLLDDMCFVQYEGKKLLVIAANLEGVCAYNTVLDKLEWKVHGKLPGMEITMAACGVNMDGYGHLFVTDLSYGNGCIQMFSVSGGQYLGCLMKDMKVLGEPIRVQWYEKTSSLLTMYYLKKKVYLKMINVQC